MANIENEPFVYSGLQSATIFDLNAYGRPKGTGLTAYTGLSVYATQVFTMNIPEPRRVPHSGNDRLLLTQIFPSKESITAELQVGAEDHDIIALLSGLSLVNIIEAQMMPLATQKQGKEPNVGMFLSQAALGQSGLQRYHTYAIPSTKAVPRAPGAQENPEPYRYSLSPNPVLAYLWGPDIVDDASQATESAVQSLFSEGELGIAAFIADGVEDQFLFPTDAPAFDVNKIAVYTASGSTVTPVTVDITKATTGVTFDYAPANLTEVILFYQKAN